MAESKAAASEVPAHILPGMETMTTKTMQIDRDLEVPLGEIQPQRIPMNPELLKAIRSGDKSLLDNLLQSENVTSRASMGEITITVSEDTVAQKDARCLLGVTLEGNTALHIVASRGHVELAAEICQRERSLWMAPNTMLDTPLHCAARAGDDKMVSLIIQFAREDEIEVRKVLMARNWDEANALHEAAKYGHLHVAKLLIEEDVELASMLNDAGMSPLYLAIAMGSLNVAKALLQSSSWEKASLTSYKGPSNQTALHAGICINKEITKDLLQREPTLAKVTDSSGRIPLHYAALHGNRDVVKLLLERDPSTAYLSDADGFFPIHFAAMKGNFPAIDEILEQCPNADELLDEQGKNFLHVAFQWRELNVVKKIISKRSDLGKLLNDQDKKGNAPLHTAVENKDQQSVHFLLRHKTVNVNVINHDGLTPLDLASAKLDEGLHFQTSAANCILSSLAFAKALLGPTSQWYALKKVPSSDVNEVKEKSPSEKDREEPSGDVKDKKDSSRNEEEEMKKWWGEEMKKQQDEEMKKWEDAPKTFAIATTLIATVTFTAGFTVLGGYIADDHLDRGTVVLAKEYAFKVFLVSDSSAFVSSILATVWLIQAGTSVIDKPTRQRYLFLAMWCLRVAYSGIVTAFVMGIFATLAPSNNRMKILFCIITLGTNIILGFIMSGFNFYNFRKTVGIRHGYRHWIWPTTIYPYVENSLHPNLSPRRAIISPMLQVWGCYAIYFLLPMFWASKY